MICRDQDDQDKHNWTFSKSGRTFFFTKKSFPGEVSWAWVRQTLRHCAQEEVSPSAGEEGDPSSQDQVQESPGEKVPGRSQVHPQESSSPNYTQATPLTPSYS